MEQKDECIRRAYKLLDKSRKYNKKDDLNNSVMMNKKTAFEILMCKYMFNNQNNEYLFLRNKLVLNN